MKLINEQRILEGLSPWELRIGIHIGPIVAGVVGKKKYAYDIWGSTVNIASRMETNGEPGQVNISAATYELVKDHFDCTYRGKIYAKNIGEIDMYFVRGPKFNVIIHKEEVRRLSERLS
jgi:class 3 adenylate cyclase